MAMLCTFTEGIGNICRFHSLLDHPTGICYKKSGSGGERTTVNHMNMPELFSSNTAVLMSTGK